jgi:hypothetical protein
VVGDWEILFAPAVAFGVIVCVSICFEILKLLGRLVWRFIKWMVFQLKEWWRRSTDEDPPEPEVDPYIASIEALTIAVNANTASLDRMITAMGGQSSRSNG